MVHRKFTLHFRIAAIIFVLEAVMILLVLGITLDQSSKTMEKLMGKTEAVILDLLGDMARVALLTGEYDDLQSHVERAAENPRIEKLLVYDVRSVVLVSSDVLDVGGEATQFQIEINPQWRQKEMRNSVGALGTIAVKYSSAALSEAKSTAFEVGFTVAIFGMFMIAIIGMIAGYLMTRKLAMLSSVAREVASGNLDVKAGFEGNDEISTLGQVFDQMISNIQKKVAELRARETELQKAHGDLEKRVRERTEELALARDEAVRASQAKSDFLANMSHELRTPLNAIIGYSDLLIEESEGVADDDYVDDLTKIRSSGKHLLGLVNNVLDLSKIEAGKMRVHVTDVNLDELVKDVITNTRPQIEKNNNHFVLQNNHDVLFIHNDESMLKQTLINLVGNAAKFTHDGEVILTISTHSRFGVMGVQFEIRDTGIGMDAEQTDGLFEQFAQADSSFTRKYEGTGLGLTISRHFCRLMGGDISVQSELGVGTAFFVWVPISYKPPKETSSQP